MSIQHVYVVMFNRVFTANSWEECEYRGKPLVKVTQLYPIYTKYWDSADSYYHEWIKRDSAYLRRDSFWLHPNKVFKTLGAAKQYYHDNYP